MPRHLALLALERSYFSSPRLAAVLATSAGTAEEVVTGYGVAPDRVAVMPNGFDHDEFNLAVRADQRADQRARMGADGQIVILFVANELHRKGFATLIEAVARVGDPRLRVDVVGRAPTDGYAAHIHGLGLDDRVRWHGPQRDVAPWYAAADLCVLPTQYEPFGNVIVESLATGTPVITTEVAGASSAVRPTSTGCSNTTRSTPTSWPGSCATPSTTTGWPPGPRPPPPTCTGSTGTSSPCSSRRR